MEQIIIHGNHQEKLLAYAENSMDSLVTDPPYGYKFMNKKWDYSVPSVDEFKGILRVLKPGAYGCW